MISHVFCFLAAVVSLCRISLAHGDTCGWGRPRAPHHRYSSVCIDDDISVIDTSSASSFSPWTHKPFCVEAAEEPWCVFTNAASPKGHGISIVTTPSLAATNFSHFSFDFDRPFFAPGKLLDHGLADRPFEVRRVPGKGMGVIATRRIPKDRVVLVDYASLLTSVAYPADVMKQEVWELLDQAVAGLGNPESIINLATNDMVRETGERLSHIENVIMTNAFGVTVAGKEYMAVFADLARINHACNPNAFIHFSESTLATTVWSARDIEPGEEITITYSTAGLKYKERREVLEKTWGFQCTCSLCSAPPQEIEASDKRRTKIQTLRRTIAQLAERGDFDNAIAAAESLFSVVEDEGLTEQMGDMYELPARLYYQLGKLDKAIDMALKVKHEVDGYGVPGRLGEERLKELDGILRRLRKELAIQKAKEAVKPKSR